MPQPETNSHRYERRPYEARPTQPRPPETVLAEDKVIVERKVYLITRRENVRGQFLRIIEANADGSPTMRTNQIIVPLPGVADLAAAIAKHIPPA